MYVLYACIVNFALIYGITQAALHRPVITLNALSSTVFMSLLVVLLTCFKY